MPATMDPSIAPDARSTPSLKINKEMVPMTGQPDDRAIVEALLAQHQVTPSPAEVTEFVRRYAGNRKLVESLASMPGVRYEEPAVLFDPRAV
ncbi:hypothetical protein [Microlunatus soli]|uniref:Uncharacterized protein n=1 Tax=Microlunatus soli TaxID=630515 RepID=A0A1H1Z4G0_9ACTN|nr:hypothetical protein [Microlunatus soli]SDT28507.1 hypothetical protein SAMN04489812_4972 [Microlunatus soli]